jgi:hypothetical protein
VESHTRWLDMDKIAGRNSGGIMLPITISGIREFVM